MGAFAETPMVEKGKSFYTVFLFLKCKEFVYDFSPPAMLLLQSFILCFFENIVFSLVLMDLEVCAGVGLAS